MNNEDATDTTVGSVRTYLTFITFVTLEENKEIICWICLLSFKLRMKLHGSLPLLEHSLCCWWTFWLLHHRFLSLCWNILFANWSPCGSGRRLVWLDVEVAACICLPLFMSTRSVLFVVPHNYSSWSPGWGRKMVSSGSFHVGNNGPNIRPITALGPKKERNYPTVEMLLQYNYNNFI